jgi:hypothetical protein
MKLKNKTRDKNKESLKFHYSLAASLWGQIPKLFFY